MKAIMMRGVIHDDVTLEEAEASIRSVSTVDGVMAMLLATTYEVVMELQLGKVVARVASVIVLRPIIVEPSVVLAW